MLNILLQPHVAWNPKDLDIYVATHAFTPVARHLTSVQGYTRDPDVYIAGPYGFLPDVVRVAPFTKGPVLKIDVIISTHHPFLPISHFWCTTLMNAVCAQGIYCAYPQDVFRQRAVVNLLRRRDHLRPAQPPRKVVVKYTARGFDCRVDHLSWASEGFTHTFCLHDHDSCPSVSRFLGDHRGFWIPFDTTRTVPTSLTPASPNSLTVAWNIGGWCMQTWYDHQGRAVPLHKMVV